MIDQTPTMVSDMYDLYKAGWSLQRIATKFECSAGTIGGWFHRRGWAVRASPRAISRKRWKAVEHNGLRFTPDKNGYMRCTSRVGGKAAYIPLHRVIWEERHGPIPAGMMVSFKDGNRAHWHFKNLELVTVAQVLIRRRARNNAHTKGMASRSFGTKHCLSCANEMKPRMLGKVNPKPEGPAAFAKRHFCSNACHSVWMKGRPKGSKLAKVNWRADLQPMEHPFDRVVAKVGTRFSRDRASAPLIARVRAAATPIPADVPQDEPIAQAGVNGPDEAVESVEAAKIEAAPTPRAPAPTCPECKANELPAGMARCLDCREKVMRRMRESNELSKRTGGMGAV